MNARVFAFTAVLSLGITGAFAGLLTARSMGTHLRSILGREGEAPRRALATRAQRLLVCAEVALSLILLVTAALMLRSFRELAAVDVGFVSDRVVALRVEIPSSLHAREGYGVARRLLGRLAGVPGVESAALVCQLPMSGSSMSTTARTADIEKQPVHLDLHGVSDGFFKTLSIPLIDGRDVSLGTSAAATSEVVVNQAAARLLWPGMAAVGQTIFLQWGPGIERRVVGVVGDVKHRGVRSRGRPAVYLPYDQLPHRVMTAVVRGGGEALVPTLRTGARQEKSVVISEVRPLRQVIRGSMARTRDTALVFCGLALIGLMLAAIGIYGVVSYAVALRRRDFGVCLALGATPRRVLRSALRDGLGWASGGIGLGIAGSLIATRMIDSLLFGVAAGDPWTVAGMSALVGAVAAVAITLAARAAARVDPAEAFRSTSCPHL